MNKDVKQASVPIYWKPMGEGIELYCHIQPGARCEGFAGMYGDALKIRLKAAAVDGKANAACLVFLAKAFAVQRAEVVLLKGLTSRDKRWWIKKLNRWPDELPGTVPFLVLKVHEVKHGIAG